MVTSHTGASQATASPAEYPNFRLYKPSQTLSTSFYLAIEVTLIGRLLPTEGRYKPQRLGNLEQLSVHTKFIHAKFSNTTSAGKNLNFNQVRDQVMLLPLLVFSHYALLEFSSLVPKHHLL